MLFCKDCSFVRTFQSIIFETFIFDKRKYKWEYSSYWKLIYKYIAASFFRAENSAKRENECTIAGYYKNVRLYIGMDIGAVCSSPLKIKCQHRTAGGYILFFSVFLRVLVFSFFFFNFRYRIFYYFSFIRHTPTLKRAGAFYNVNIFRVIRDNWNFEIWLESLIRGEKWSD